MSVSSVPKRLARYRANGTVAPSSVVGKRPWLLVPHRDRAHALFTETPRLTLDRLQEQYAREGVR